MDRNRYIKVSVLVPVYNVEDLLPRCLDSLINQTLKDIEIVCVNDASTDSSDDILNDYAKRDPRIRVIAKPQNEGLMMARKTGYENATGEYYFFCDSDDYLPTDAIEKLYDSAISTNAGITVGSLYMINVKGQTTLRPRNGINGQTGREYLCKILSGTTCSLCGSLFRRDLFDNYNYRTLKNQSFSEDRLLLTQILLYAKPSVSTISHTSYYYWVNIKSITRRELTHTLLKEQLYALFFSYDIINSADKSLKKLNDEFIIHYLSQYLEKGPWKNLIINYNETSARLLSTACLRKSVPKHLFAHTWMLLNVPLYRHLAMAGRRAIRKLQGKV